MEKRTPATARTRFLQLLTLVAFATMALASSSSKDATRNINDFIDGWEQSGGRQLNSIENADSISGALAPQLACEPAASASEIKS